MLKLESIKGGYEAGSLILQGIDLKISLGEVVGIIGLNGCGKSTLGKAIMNMLPFRSGKIYFNNEDISQKSAHHLHQAGISMVMQGGRIFPNMSVWEHLQLACGKPTDLLLKKRITELENNYGLTIFSNWLKFNRKGSYLCGGEKQQLALVMALLNNPKLLILDEPSAGLSPTNSQRMIDTLEQLKTSGGISILLIEQNISLAVQLSDRLLLLERGIIDQQFIVDSTFDFHILNQNIFN